MNFTKMEYLGPYNQLSPTTFYWHACTKSEKWAAMYMYRFCLFLRFFYWIVKLSRHCGIFCLSFYC